MDIRTFRKKTLRRSLNPSQGQNEARQYSFVLIPTVAVGMFLESLSDFF